MPDTKTPEKQAAAPAWANPTPAGLVALAVACFCFFAMLTGNVTSAALPLIACWLLGGFVIQVIVALIDLKGGNLTGGNTFLFFSAFFMLVSSAEMLIKYTANIKELPLDASVDGWAWIVLTLIVWLWTPAFFKNPLPMTLLVLCLDVACPAMALLDLGIISKSYSVIPAWALLIAGVVAIYFSAAIVVNGAYKKTVFPIPGPISK